MTARSSLQRELQVDDAAFFLRLIGAGDLDIESAGRDGQSHFDNVRHPDMVQQEIYRQMEANARRQASWSGQAAAAAGLGAPTAVPVHDEPREAVALEIAVEDRIGEEGQGFRTILHGMNPERILIAAEAAGLGRAALTRAARYAGERIVFDRPIGKNQGVAHPLAERWIELEAAELLWQKAAWKYDAGEPCGAEANAAKYFAAEAGFRACETAVLTHGGMGYAKEYHVERYMREAMIARIAPVSPQMVLNFVAEKVLGLPKSY